MIARICWGQSGGFFPDRQPNSLLPANFSLRRSENSLLDGLGNWLSTPAESLACQPRGSSSTGSEIAEFPAISLLSREFDMETGSLENGRSASLLICFQKWPRRAGAGRRHGWRHW